MSMGSVCFPIFQCVYAQVLIYLWFAAITLLSVVQSAVATFSFANRI